MCLCSLNIGSRDPLRPQGAETSSVPQCVLGAGVFSAFPIGSMITLIPALRFGQDYGHCCKVPKHILSVHIFKVYIVNYAPHG